MPRRTPAEPEPTPDRSDALLEYLWSTYGRQLIPDIQKNVQDLETRLRQLTDPVQREQLHREYMSVETGLLVHSWMLEPALILRARQGLLCRLAWFEIKATGAIPPPFAELAPDDADLIRQFVLAYRFQAFKAVDLVHPTSWQHTGTSIYEQTVTRHLTAARLTVNNVVRPAFRGPIGNTPRKEDWNWRRIEARVASQLALQAKLQARLERLRQAGEALARAMPPLVEAALADLTVDALARGYFEAEGHSARYPVRELPGVTSAAQAIARAEASLPSHLTDRERVLAEMTAEYRSAIDRLKSQAETERAGRVDPVLSELRRRVEFLARGRGANGWAEIGETIDRLPRAFPDGAADRWLQPAVEGLLAAGPEVILEILDGEPGKVPSNGRG